MKAELTCSPAKGHLVMVTAIAVVVSIFTLLDVQISLARIDMNDPATWPNMSPQVRYFFIPVLSAYLAVPAVIINFILSFIDRRRLLKVKHWAAFGAAFASVTAVLPIAHLGINGPIVFWFLVGAALLMVIMVRRLYGIPK
jgi:hypothetical protein